MLGWRGWGDGERSPTPLDKMQYTQKNLAIPYSCLGGEGGGGGERSPTPLDKMQYTQKKLFPLVNTSNLKLQTL